MIGVGDALSMVLERARPRAPLPRPITMALGDVLAEDILSAVDSPPHDKAQVDGYALRAADLAVAGTRLRVLEEITAGQVPSQTVIERSATRVMTGAPIPTGADCVVMVERSQSAIDDDGLEWVTIADHSLRSGQNIMRRGESIRCGDTVLRTGHHLRAIEIGLLAELGMQQINVFRQPRVAVLATGNELVPLDQQPAPGQIRNSNGPMLTALTLEGGAEPIDLGIARDTQADLTDRIGRGLDCDVLLLSGGVSAGILDLVPQVLRQLGVEQVFHKVNLKPGKPLWFGTYDRHANHSTLVFGLPGNPVSSLVCFHLFVRPALAGISGRNTESIRQVSARLAADHPYNSDRPTYYPGQSRQIDGELYVQPLDWHGSSDLRTLADANVLIYFPPNSDPFRAHQSMTVYLL